MTSSHGHIIKAGRWRGSGDGEAVESLAGGVRLAFEDRLGGGAQFCSPRVHCSVGSQHVLTGRLEAPRRLYNKASVATCSPRKH